MVRDVVQEQLPSDGRDAHAGLFPRTHSQKPGGDQTLRIAWLQLVSGDLLEDELSVGLFLGEAADYVIRGAPVIRTLKIIGVSIGIGISHDVKPMPRPAFPIVRRREQALHDSPERAGRIILYEGVDV